MKLDRGTFSLTTGVHAVGGFRGRQPPTNTFEEPILGRLSDKFTKLHVIYELYAIKGILEFEATTQGVNYETIF